MAKKHLYATQYRKLHTNQKTMWGLGNKWSQKRPVSTKVKQANGIYRVQIGPYIEEKGLKYGGHPPLRSSGVRWVNSNNFFDRPHIESGVSELGLGVVDIFLVAKRWQISLGWCQIDLSICKRLTRLDRFGKDNSKSLRIWWNPWTTKGSATLWLQPWWARYGGEINKLLIHFASKNCQ